MLEITLDAMRAFRLVRSGLLDPFGSVVEAAHALVGVQAQILSAAGLSLVSRSPLASHAEFERALFEDRSLIKLWGQRHTLHLYPSEQWPLLMAALRQRETWWERRVAKRGGDVEAYRSTVQAVGKLLETRGTLTRSELEASDIELQDWHLSSWGGIFADVVRRGWACHAGKAGGEGRFAHRAHWLPELEWLEMSSLDANRDIARRYLHTYGPATVHDLAYWRGGKVRDARAWIAALGDDVCEVRCAGRDDALLLLTRDREALAELEVSPGDIPDHALYRFDPVLLAHRDKTWIVDAQHYDKVWRPAGHIEPILLVGGRAAGTWRYQRKGRTLDVELRPFRKLRAAERKAVQARLRRVAGFFGLELELQ